MNVFVLSTGRCGTMTFSKACRHITNFTSGHESRLPLIGTERLAYPDNHIEIDNRLSWYLGRLHQLYGDTAFYVHLTRDTQQVAASYARRSEFGIMQAYREGILLGGQSAQSHLQLALDYIDTVNANIRLFLQDKHHTLQFRLETARQDFATFWGRIGAEGEYANALAEWDIQYNAS